jgi:ubiquinone/menaquinone biosynthesis C-methylase UbiE
MIEYNSIRQRWQWLKEKYPLCHNFDSPRSWEDPWVLHRLEELPGTPAKLLDCGCGRGTFAIYVREHLPHFQVSACDLFDSGSREGGSVKELAKSLEKKGVEYFEEDMRKLTFRDDCFDVVTCISVLEHIAESRAALHEMVRILKPGGLLVATVDIMLADGFATNRTVEELREIVSLGNVDLVRPDEIPDLVLLGHNPDVWRVSPQTWYFDWTPRIWGGKDYIWRWQSSLGYVLRKL